MSTADLATIQPVRRPILTAAVESEIERWQAKARSDFRSFRLLLNPTMLTNWWTNEVSAHFQQFYQDLIEGKRPKLALMAPPQHGKSKAVNDFIAWLAGTNPNIKVIFTSYSDELGARANVELQRAIKSDAFKGIFGRTVVGIDNWVCNQSLIEYADYRGSFRNVTIQGGITGFALDLGVIDDYTKDRAEANSQTTRAKVWEWFTDVFQTRMSKDSALLIVCTRWHIDDLLGRYLERHANDSTVKVLRYPALAEADTQFRRKGDALFPEFKPKELLLERKHEMSIGSWEAEYQQNPIIIGGGQLPLEKLKVVQIFDRSQIVSSVRYVDKAGTVSDDAAYSAFVLMHRMADKRYVIEHILRGRWSALDRESKLKELCEVDQRTCPDYRVWIEQEPGSGGKESVEASIRNLAPIIAYADKVTGAKEVRAEPFCAAVQNGDVSLYAGAWVHAFRDEAEAWPNSRYKDQIDAAAGAFAKLASATSYDTTYAAFDPYYQDR